MRSERLPAPLAYRSPATPAVRLVGRIVVVGLATGILTQLGQSLLPDGASQVANAIAPWLMVAFLTAATMPDARWAVLAGIGTMLLALIGYYLMIELRFGYGGGTGSLVLWASGALAGGGVFGLAGGWRAAGDWRGPAAIGLLAAVWIAEAGYRILILDETVLGAVFIFVGVLVPLVLGRTRSDRIRSYLWIVPALALGVLGYAAFVTLSTLTKSL